MKNRFNSLFFLVIFILNNWVLLAQIDNSANINLAEDPFVTMIKLGAMNQHNPLYTMPLLNGSAAGYIQQAITTGDGIVIPLAYAKNTAPQVYYIIESRNPNIIQRGREFSLKLNSVNMDGKKAYIFADWTRDGNFETLITHIPIVGNEVDVQISVPNDAVLGKSRIRVLFTTTEIDEANAAITNGRIYDFVTFIANKKEQTDCFVSVAANPSEGGIARINTISNENGRYEIGTTVEIEAIPSDLYEFKGWLLLDDTISRDNKYSFEVESSVSLIAVFYRPQTISETPLVSTKDAPIWYQIKNAHTHVDRSDRYITYTNTIPIGYYSQLRCERPATTEAPYLWRIEDAGGGLVRLINKDSEMEIGSASSLSTAISVVDSGEGAKYKIIDSGHENGSFTIALNGESGKYLNAQDGLWQLVLYNAGIGTGSGWYFYRVDNDTSIRNSLSENNIIITSDSENIYIKMLGDTFKVSLYGMNGQQVVCTPWTYETLSIQPKLKDTIYILEILTKNGERYITKRYF